MLENGKKMGKEKKHRNERKRKEIKNGKNDKKITKNRHENDKNLSRKLQKKTLIFKKIVFFLNRLYVAGLGIFVN